ncbi:MAG: thioredoxin domain-containing protein [Candidatus Uhrbacteria bacterium]
MPRRWLILAAILIGAAALWAMRPPLAKTSPAKTAPAAALTATTPTILSTDPIRGPTNAPLTIIEFSDLTCPTCATIESTLTELRALYGERLRIVWKDLPHLNSITGSRALHIGARCAQAQGKFWEYHDAILDSATRSPADVPAVADAIRLDLTAFTACVVNPQTAAKVDAGIIEARSLNITDTPTFFVNGKVLHGSMSLTEFRELLDRPAPAQ